MTAKDVVVVHVAEVVAFARWLVSKGPAVPLDDLLAMWRRTDERPRD